MSTKLEAKIIVPRLQLLYVVQEWNTTAPHAEYNKLTDRGLFNM
jgi:hypothetical protein